MRCVNIQASKCWLVNVDDAREADSVRALARELHLSFPILRDRMTSRLSTTLFIGICSIDIATSDFQLRSWLTEQGEIVKVYQGSVNGEHIENDFRHIPQTSAERLAKAMPFPGVSDTSEFRRNYLSYGSVFFQRGYFDQAEASFQPRSE